jgi:hypothetical protein
MKTELLHYKYIQIQFVPHRKHIMSPLQSPARWCCVGKESLFNVRTVRNTKIQSVPHRKHISSTLQRLSGWCSFGKQSLFIVTALWSTKIQSVPHRKHTTSLLQSATGYCENHTEHIHTVHTSQGTYSISTTEPNTRCLFENRTEHINTVRTSQKAYYISATETNRTMAAGETVTVYCENYKRTQTNKLRGP